MLGVDTIFSNGVKLEEGNVAGGWAINVECNTVVFLVEVGEEYSSACKGCRIRNVEEFARNIGGNWSEGGLQGPGQQGGSR